MEQNRKTSPGRSTTRRNLFSSIINFSVSQGVKVGTPGSTQANTILGTGTTTGSNINEKQESPGEKVLNRNKSRGNLSISENHAVKITNGSSGNSPLGQAPKTFSVLTALNELESSKERRDIDRNLPSSGNFPGYIVPSPSNHSEGSGNEFLGNTQRMVPRIPRQSQTLAVRPKPKSIQEKVTPIKNGSKSTSSSKTSKSKERTPDWIWKIFQLAKHGRLEDLKTSLVDLDPTLIRHLADTKGNTLLHCAARGGHLLTLQFLVSILGVQTEAAFNDQNRAGRTVILTTLKAGQLECFQWIVLHTSFGDKALVPSEGKWSLLHFASKYGNEGAVRWLCEQMLERQVRVDLRDPGGLTPLHVSAKAGHIGVSQELIRAGADPLCQTELGWRPSDLAFRHHHKECGNYLIMAEAAGSLSKDLSTILMDFKTLHQQQETLRTQFREVLRVAKLLIKERGDLIKRFGPSGGSGGGGETNGSPPPLPQTTAALLLGGTVNGVRLSELEHSIVQGEQGWRKIEGNRVELPFFLSNGRGHDLAFHNMTLDLLQTRLLISHARHDKNVASGVMMSASSEEDESSLSAVTSGDEESSVDPRLKSCLRNRKRMSGPGNPSSSPMNGIISNSPLRSANTPWLLESDDSILSALSSPSRIPNNSTSQHFHNLDLLKLASASNLILSRNGPNGRNSSSSENSPLILRSKVYLENEEPLTPTNSSSAAAVLEVIEPLQGPPKFGGQSSPMTKAVLRRASLSQSTSSTHSISPSALDPSLSSAIENELHITSTGRMRRRGKVEDESESQLSPSYGLTTGKKEFEEIYLTPDLIRGTQHQNGGRPIVPVLARMIPDPKKSMVHQPTKPTNRGSEENYSDIEGNHFATFHSTRNSHSTDGSLAVGPKGGNFTRTHISSTLSGLTTTKTKKSKTTSSGSLSPEPITPATTSTFPPEFFLLDGNSSTTSFYSPDQQQGNSQIHSSPYVSVSPSSKTRKNYGTSLTILPLESSESPAQQLHLQFQEPSPRALNSDGEMTSTFTALTHLPNDSSSSSNPPIIPDTHSSASLSSPVVFPYGKATWTGESSTTFSAEGQLSPTPSETSRTESTFAPPPSHTSEISKTESADGLGESITTNSRLLLEDHRVCEEDEDDRRKDSEEEVGEEDKKRFKEVYKIRRDDKPDDEGSDKEHLGSRIPQNIETTTTPCLIRHTQIIHKTPTHHRVKKSTRGRVKPWYEIEGSDDEGSLLRVARARSRSSCHSTSSLSAPEEESESEEEGRNSFCDDQDGHECDSTNCSRHNCPDFV